MDVWLSDGAAVSLDGFNAKAWTASAVGGIGVGVDARELPQGVDEVAGVDVAPVADAADALALRPAPVLEMCLLAVSSDMMPSIFCSSWPTRVGLPRRGPRGLRLGSTHSERLRAQRSHGVSPGSDGQLHLSLEMLQRAHARGRNRGTSPPEADDDLDVLCALGVCVWACG